MATIRVDDRTHGLIRDLAGDRPMNEVIREAVEDLRRKRFFDRFNAAYEALRGDPAAWVRELRERAEWETTLGDGLEGDPA